MSSSIQLLILSLLLVVPSTHCCNSRYTTSTVTNPKTNESTTDLFREPSAYLVYTQHLSYLNACNWNGLLSQYPDQAEVHLPGGNVIRGRAQIADLFTNFVLSRSEGGLCGLTFTEVSRWQVGTTLNVRWIADAPFLARPYHGADAYVSDDGLLVAMTSTFNGDDLEFVGEVQYTMSSVMNTNTGEKSETLKRERTPKLVADVHLNLLNNCDWKGIMDQYPDQAELFVSGGVSFKGRQGISTLFEGFMNDRKDGGLCGLKFKVESSFSVAGVVNVQWEADADFLKTPYKGSSACVTEDGLMVAMITTFNGDDLEFK